MKKFDRIRMCFGYGFSLANADFEDDAVLVGSQLAATPQGWSKVGKDVLVVSNDNPSYNRMDAASGKQFVEIAAEAGISTSVAGLTPIDSMKS